MEGHGLRCTLKKAETCTYYVLGIGEVMLFVYFSFHCIDKYRLVGRLDDGPSYCECSDINLSMTL